MIVTGAASGIGRACVERLSLAGWSVIALDVTPMTASDYREADALRVRTGTVDLTDTGAVSRLFAELIKDDHSVSAVVNVAGAVRAGSAVDTDDANWRWNLDTNATSAFAVCRAVIPHLVARGGGSIVNFSSLTALKPMKERAGYAAAKGAVLALSRQLAFEYGAHGIRVNTIVPGAIRTPLLDQRLAVEPELEAQLSDRVPLNRLGRPAELAALVEFLVSDECAYLTGQEIAVDGGLGIA